MTKYLSYIFLFLMKLSLISEGFAQQKVKIDNSSDNPGHYLIWNGKRLLLIGDSVTQGWMESGTNFNQTAYINALASKGINVILLWAYFATNANYQRNDDRVGYNSPEIWPWAGSPDQNSFNLRQFNQNYFNRLKQFVAYAETKGIIVVITVHDGWIKDRFNAHPFNEDLGNGPLPFNDDYVELYNYDSEMPSTYNSSWNWQQRNQYFQERFCDKLINELNPYTNVIYEMFNEGEWFNVTLRRKHEEHFLEFFRDRCDNLLMTNTDHISGDNPHSNSDVDIISLHGGWEDRFIDFTNGFNRTPSKPYFLSEPVPSWYGNTSLKTVIRCMWEVALAGAGWVNQNDLSFGWDPNTEMADLRSLRDSTYIYAGHCSRFFNNSEINFSAMKPNSSLASSGICMANSGNEYIVFVPGNTVNVNLPNQMNARVRWFNPRSGALIDGGIVSGTTELFNPPSGSDWILHLKAVTNQSTTTRAFYMSSPNDDIMYYSGSSNKNASRFGETSNIYRGIQQIFKNVTIPRNAQITSAILTVRAKTSGSGIVVSDIYSDLRDDPSSVLTYSQYNSNTNFSSVTYRYTAPNYSAGNYYQINITNVIQDRINKSNWTNGDNLGIIIKGNTQLSSSFRDITTAENSLSYNKLTITYTSSSNKFAGNIGGENSLPEKYELFQNYPNPFNPTTTIQFNLPEGATVRLDVFNILGEHIVTLVNEEMEAGFHSVLLDATNLSSGTYIYRLYYGNTVQSKKMLLLK